jgi:hypothetical protein
MDGSRSDTAATGAAVVGNHLNHHGIKGMKWGVRKGSSSSDSTSSRPGSSSDHEEAEAIKTKLRSGGVKSLANHELVKLNTRMQLEQTQRNLQGQKPTTFDKGHHHVKKILSTGKTLADIYNTVNSPAGKALKTVIKKGASS